MRGGGLREKFEGGGMPERVKKMKCGGVAGKNGGGGCRSHKKI